MSIHLRYDSRRDSFWWLPSLLASIPTIIRTVCMTFWKSNKISNFDSRVSFTQFSQPKFKSLSWLECTQILSQVFCLARIVDLRSQLANRWQSPEDNTKLGLHSAISSLFTNVHCTKEGYIFRNPVEEFVEWEYFLIHRSPEMLTYVLLLCVDCRTSNFFKCSVLNFHSLYVLVYVCRFVTRAVTVYLFFVTYYRHHV